MKKVNIVYGSVRGGTTRIANYLAEQLGSDYDIHLTDQPDASNFDPADFYVFLTSNTGQGELPPGLRPFYTCLKTEFPRIAGLRYALINCGHSSYDTFGFAGQALDEALQDIGAINVTETLVMDASEDRYPEERAFYWLKGVLKQVLNADSTH